jgi:CPA2 family monovalent cation:H+ antiporter-2
MHNLSLLINIASALSIAFLGGLIFRRLGLPTIVGYLLAGVAIGPFTPGYIGDPDTINQLAELGVIFLMFGVGLHFSFRDLWQVRDIAIVGALGQMATTAALGYWLTRQWGWPPYSGIVLGLAVSVASTIVLLRGLMDNGLLNTSHGQVAVGWLVMEDLATVLILLVLPTLADVEGGIDWRKLGFTTLAALGFLVYMVLVGSRLIPWILLRVAHTRSRELFILANLTVALGTALGSAELFGVSLALGAFMAGVVVSESPLSHQIAADLLPFREAFSVLFFVSIGMLLDPLYLVENVGPVIALTGLIIFGKPFVTAFWAFMFPRPARTALIVAAGTSQIGEFSFILGQTGLSLGLLEKHHYSLILAGALVSIVLNPLMFRLVGIFEGVLRRMPPLWKVLDRHGRKAASEETSLASHIVVIGCGRVGRHIAEVAEYLGLPYLVVEADAERVHELDLRGVPTLMGDAANSEVLTHAALDRARLLVVTLPEEAASELAVAAARDLAPSLPIIARAATRAGVRRLAELGAQQVIHPEMEGGLQLVRYALLQLGFSMEEVRRYAESVRRDHYSAMADKSEEQRLLRESLDRSDALQIAWLRLPPDSPWVGQPWQETAVSSRTGADLATILRDGELLTSPEPGSELHAGDYLELIGNSEQLAAAQRLLTAAEPQ